MRVTSFGALLLGFGVPVFGQFSQWCGKYYQVGSPTDQVRPADSLFPYPEISEIPLLDFRCVTASSFYIENDAGDPPMMLIDSNITYDIGQPYYGNGSGSLQVEVYVNGDTLLTSGAVKVGSLGTLLAFNTSGLDASATSLDITCKATLNGQVFSDNTTLAYLPPNPYGGNSVKIDRKSGALIIKNSTADAEWEKIIPFGWYDSYNTSSTSVYGSQYSGDARNDTLTRLHMAKERGFNFVHIVPPGGYEPYTFSEEATALFEEYISTAESLGLYIMYDMRNSFLNLSSVELQINYLKDRSNILLWYTGDEPDGQQNPLNSTKLAYDLIYELDGYHPVSLVLNCENYYFQEYGLDGADIVLVDPYPIALNGAWSKRYNTYVDEDYGCGGCDNCRGTFYDQTERIESSRNRARLAGVGRSKPTWMVPQAFDDGQQEFWYRVPTGDEEAVQSVLAWNHGAVGHCAWNSQYATLDLLNNGSFIANQLYAQSRFLIDAADSRQQVFSNLSYGLINGYDMASWTVSNSNGTTETLVFAVNFNYPATGVDGIFTMPNITGTVSEVLFGDVTVQDDGTPLFSMPRTSIAGVIMKN